MNDQPNSIIAQHKNKLVILDTNILLVFLVGSIDRQLITTFKRTNSRYCAEDFDILNKLIGSFTKLTTTPNILTEVSNLGSQLSGDANKQFFEFLSIFIQQTTETYIPSSEISKDALFIKFGITDRVILELARTEHLIITDDYKLAGYCKNSVNFNHLRNYVV
jgi:hypothetical protein